MFDAVDIDDDRRIDLSEFKRALPLLAQWGVLIRPADADAEFRCIDGNDGGQVLFDEFAGWGLRRGLDQDEHDNVEGEKSLVEKHDASKPPSSPRPRSARTLHAPNRKWATPSNDLTTMISVLPCGTNEADVLGRAEIFELIDDASVNGCGTGVLSLEQLDVRVHDVLTAALRGPPPLPGTPAATPVGRFKSKNATYRSDPRVVFLSPALAFAYRAVTEPEAKQRVGKGEFRLLLTYLKYDTPPRRGQRVPKRPTCG